MSSHASVSVSRASHPSSSSSGSSGHSVGVASRSVSVPMLAARPPALLARTHTNPTAATTNTGAALAGNQAGQYHLQAHPATTRVDYFSGEDDDDTSSDECSDMNDDDAILPPLVPPFRFACVETGRSVVGGASGASWTSAAVPVWGRSASEKTKGSSRDPATPTSSTPATPQRERRGSNANPPGQMMGQGLPAAALSSVSAQAGLAAAAAAKPAGTSGLLNGPQPSPPTSPSRSNSLTSSITRESSHSSRAGPPSTPLPPVAPLTAEMAIYRGSYPTLKNFRFLSRLRLRTIVSLVPETPTADLKSFCRAGGRLVPPPPGAAPPTPIRLYHFDVPQYAENVAISSRQVLQVLQILCDADRLPAYVHCTDGLNNTSLVVACLRKLQGWTMMASLAEMLRFTRETTGGVIDAERAFIARFNHDGLPLPHAAGGPPDATPHGHAPTPPSSKHAAATPHFLFRVPLRLPNWLWGGAHLLAHPLGLRLYDAHVPAFAAVHSKLLAPDAPPTPLPGASALPTPVVWRLVDESDALWDGRDAEASDDSDPDADPDEDEETRRKRRKKRKKAKERARAAEEALRASNDACTADGREDGADNLLRVRSRAASSAGAAGDDEKKGATPSAAGIGGSLTATTAAASGPPQPSPTSPPLSHPGEVHSLHDLDRSAWSWPISHIKCDLLFRAGSFTSIVRLADPAATKWRAPDPRQWVEMAGDREEEFTKDELDAEVSPLVASMALEGLTMNHKITRPMQLSRAHDVMRS